MLTKFRYAGALPVGEPVPAFCLPDLEGNEHCLSEWKGHQTCLVFVKPSCPPCKQQLADLVRLYQVFRQKDCVIVTVLLERPEGGDTLPFPVLIDEADVFRKAYGGVPTPALFLLDRNHVLRFHVVGYRAWHIDSLLVSSI